MNRKNLVATAGFTAFFFTAAQAGTFATAPGQGGPDETEVWCVVKNISSSSQQIKNPIIRDVYGNVTPQTLSGCGQSAGIILGAHEMCEYAATKIVPNYFSCEITTVGATSNFRGEMDFENENGTEIGTAQDFR
jgi:hypothetical protein